MRKIIIYLCLFMSMTHALPGRFDFEFYKAATIKFLPALDIDPSGLVFTLVRHDPTTEERRKNPGVVFINMEKLSQFFSVRDALFECLVEAQLSRIPANDWKHILHVEREPRPIFDWMPYVLLSPLVCYGCRWLTLRSAFKPSQEIPCTVLTFATTVASSILFASKQEVELPDFVIVKRNFERKLFFIKLNTVRILFNSHIYAPIALYGAMSTKWHYRKMNAHAFFGFDVTGLGETLENMSRAFIRWTEMYPNAFQDILVTDSLTQQFTV
jgi:hypothetical protein